MSPLAAVVAPAPDDLDEPDGGVALAGLDSDPDSGSAAEADEPNHHHAQLAVVPVPVLGDLVPGAVAIGGQVSHKMRNRRRNNFQGCRGCLPCTAVPRVGRYHHRLPLFVRPCT